MTRPGDVVNVFSPIAGKDKLVVILDPEEGLCLHISSRPFRSPETNVKIEQARHRGFLHHDSHVYLQPAKIEDLAAQVEAEPARRRGALHVSARQAIVEAANTCETLTPQQIKLIASRLRSAP